MGLDILLVADNYKELYKDAAGNHIDYQHSLSRDFCNFMCRQNVVSHKAELDQLGEITGIDVSPIYDMESYPGEEWLSFSLDTAESGKEKHHCTGRSRKTKFGRKHRQGLEHGYHLS